MTSSLRRQSFLVITIFVLGWTLGYLFCTTLLTKSCDAIIFKHGRLDSSNRTTFPVTSASRKQLSRLGTVFDCLSWDIRYRYNAELVQKDYTTFPAIEDGAEGDAQRQKSFVEIYQRQLWIENKDAMVDQSDKLYKASGPGASLEAAQGIIAVLHKIVDGLKEELNKTRLKVLDLPCGDLQWMSHFLNTRSDIDYTGMDIVPELIEKHKRTYAGKSNVNFNHFDIVKTKLDVSYDLIICRMMLQHLLNADVLKALYHFSSSKSIYFGATTFPEVTQNEELVPLGGRLRFLNLEIPPFSLSPPVCTFPEPSFLDHYFSIWKLPLLQKLG